MIRARPALTVVLALLAGVCALAPAAPAQAAEGGEAPTWRLEQPVPPELPTGQKSNIPTGLGRIGDIEFWAPNRGVLITDGNSTIKPGVWYYNGTGWREIASVCGATDGRIAWAGPEEFWTVSDGRKGQSTSEGTPPLADNTLCHFAPATEGEQRPLEVVGSYASLAFLPSSYQAMDGAGCLSSEDCWFAGGPLPDEQVGSFHLHWNGHQMEAEPGPQGHAVSSISRFGPVLYEGVRIESGDLDSEEEPPTEPSLIHAIEPTGVQPRFVSLFPTDLSLANKRLPIYSTGESPEALTGPLLASDEGALWAALNPIQEVSKSTPGEITILRENQQEKWSQLLGPETDPVEGNPFNNPANPNRAPLVQRIAPEPPSATEAGEGREQALLALASRFEQQSERSAVASVATIGSDGAVSSVSTLPGRRAAEGTRTARLRERRRLPGRRRLLAGDQPGLPVPSRHRRRPRAPRRRRTRPGPRRPGADRVAPEGRRRSPDDPGRASGRRLRVAHRTASAGEPKPRKSRKKKKASSICRCSRGSRRRSAKARCSN